MPGRLPGDQDKHQVLISMKHIPLSMAKANQLPQEFPGRVIKLFYHIPLLSLTVSGHSDTHPLFHGLSFQPGERGCK